jgi:hypothetical protein
MVASFMSLTRHESGNHALRTRMRVVPLWLKRFLRPGVPRYGASEQHGIALKQQDGTSTPYGMAVMGRPSPAGP